MASENVKNHPKTFNQLETKNLPEFISIFRFFQGNKTPNINSPNYMESFDTKVDCFSGGIVTKKNSLSTPEFSDPFSLLHPKMNWKHRKIKLGTKIKFLNIRMTNYLLAKKDWELKWILQANLKVTTYVICIFPLQSFVF